MLLAILGISSCAARPGVERFATLLAAENQRQNLVSGASLGSVWQRHFADSLQLLDYVPRETESGSSP